MAFSLSDYGWEAPVCPPSSGSAGYAFDDNMVFAGAVANTSQMVNTFPLNGNTAYIGTSYGRMFYCLYDVNGITTSTIPIFGKKACKLGGAGELLSVSTTSSTFTISLWLYRDAAGSSLKFVTDGSSITVGDTIVSNINGSNQSPINSGMGLNQWYYVRLICINGALSCYVNGVLKGNTSFINTGIPGNVSITRVGSAVHIKDVTVCQVARDGSFVPTNILGY